MATASPMTWNLNWKLVTGAAALTGVLGLGAPQLAGPAAPPQPSVAPGTAAQLVAVAALAEETRRLDQHLDAAQVMPSSRNLFQFGSRPVVRRAAPAPVAEPPPLPPVPPPFPLRLTGIAVDVVDGVETRTAIVSGPSGVELAVKGALASPGYRVVAVGESYVDIERTSDGARERLTLK